MIILQDSSFKQVRFRQESDIEMIAASVIDWQHVKSRVFKLTHPQTSCMMPMLVTPVHLLSPIFSKFLQFKLNVWKQESETRAPSSLIVFRFFKSFKQLRKVDEHSCKGGKKIFH